MGSPAKSNKDKNLKFHVQILAIPTLSSHKFKIEVTRYWSNSKDLEQGLSRADAYFLPCFWSKEVICSKSRKLASVHVARAARATPVNNPKAATVTADRGQWPDRNIGELSYKHI